MKIACLGWGSLIWDPRNLKIKEEWSNNGPMLPVEFIRISSDKRVTLVIDFDIDTQPINVLWARMSTDQLKEATDSLIARERSKDIHSVTTEYNEKANISLEIVNWLKTKELDAAIWTGLTYHSNNNEKYFEGKRPSVKQVIKYLRTLQGEELRRAERYIRNTPRQINTAYRREIENELGWTPIDRI